MFASIEMNRWEVKHSMEAKAGSRARAGLAQRRAAFATGLGVGVVFWAP